jgi:hypothetical protein
MSAYLVLIERINSSCTCYLQAHSFAPKCDVQEVCLGSSTHVQPATTDAERLCLFLLKIRHFCTICPGELEQHPAFGAADQTIMIEGGLQYTISNGCSIFAPVD